MCWNVLQPLCNHLPVFLYFLLSLSLLLSIHQTPLRSWWSRRRIIQMLSSRSRIATWLIRPLALCGSSLLISASSWWGLSSTSMTWCSDSSTPSSRLSTIASSIQASATFHQATQSVWGHPAVMWGRLVGHPASWLIRSLALGSPGSSSFRHCISALRSSIPQTTCRWAANADGPCSKCTTVLTARYKCMSLKWAYRSELMKVFSCITDPKVICFAGLNPVKAMHGLLPQCDAGLFGEHGRDWHPLEGVCSLAGGPVSTDARTTGFRASASWSSHTASWCCQTRSEKWTPALGPGQIIFEENLNIV